MSRTISARIVITMLAMGTAVAIWGVARLGGLDLELKDGALVETIEVGDVIGATLVAALLAGGVHALLVRLGWARWWPTVGSAALALSMLGPVYYADGADAVALMAMHFAVAIVLITGFASSASAWCCEQPWRRSQATTSHPR